LRQDARATDHAGVKGCPRVSADGPGCGQPFVDKSTIALPFALRPPDAATIAADAMKRPPLDDIVLADVGCQPDSPAIGVIAEPFVIPVELSPAGIVTTARPLRGRGSSWE
jgi:hypothetical protein